MTVEERIELVGLRRLKAICQQHGLPLDIFPPEGTGPIPGEPVLGQPFDPILSTLYRETAGAMLGDFQLYPFRDEENVVLRINRGMRLLDQEPYVSALLFGQIPLLAFYLAAVPSLADSRGFQPVIFINGYEGDQVLPVASNVDKFLMTFSMYLERAVTTPEYLVERRISLPFPRAIPDLVARDRALVEALATGRFSRLMRDDDESRHWISSVVSAPVSSGAP